jgi:hypothetical protein
MPDLLLELRMRVVPPSPHMPVFPSLRMKTLPEGYPMLFIVPPPMRVHAARDRSIVVIPPVFTIIGVRPVGILRITVGRAAVFDWSDGPEDRRHRMEFSIPIIIPRRTC